MSLQTDFGGALRAARKRVGWSQSELAQKSGVHLNTVSQVERGNADPRLSTLLALGNTLGVSLNVSVNGLPSPNSATQPDIPSQTLGSDIPAFLRQRSE